MGAGRVIDRQRSLAIMVPMGGTHSTSTIYYHDNAVRHASPFYLSSGTKLQ